MKICMVMSTPFPPRDGIGYHVFSLSQELIKSGHEVSIMTRNNKLTVESFSYEGLNVIKVPYVPLYPINLFIHSKYLNKYFKKYFMDYDLIHYHTPLVPRMDVKIPSVVTIHSSMIEEINQFESNYNFKKTVLLLYVNLITKYYIKKILNNNNIIGVSNSLKNEILKYYGPNYFINFIPNGVDINFFTPINIKTNDYFLYVGRLSQRKGLLILLEAFNEISKIRNEKLILCGDGILKADLVKKVREYGLEDRVIFTGFVPRDRILQLYQNASMFISPSTYETGPLTILEAMSCGIPVVTTSVGIVDDIIRNLKNGLIVEKNNYKDIVNKCMQILSDKSLYISISQNARNDIINEYSWDKVTNETIKIYDGVISRGTLNNEKN